MVADFSTMRFAMRLRTLSVIITASVFLAGCAHFQLPTISAQTMAPQMRWRSGAIAPAT
jgi:hypothetical protein